MQLEFKPFSQFSLPENWVENCLAIDESISESKENVRNYYTKKSVLENEVDITDELKSLKDLGDVTEEKSNVYAFNQLLIYACKSRINSLICKKVKIAEVHNVQKVIAERLNLAREKKIDVTKELTELKKLEHLPLRARRFQEEVYKRVEDAWLNMRDVFLKKVINKHELKTSNEKLRLISVKLNELTKKKYIPWVKLATKANVDIDEEVHMIASNTEVVQKELKNTHKGASGKIAILLLSSFALRQKVCTLIKIKVDRRLDGVLVSKIKVQTHIDNVLMSCFKKISQRAEIAKKNCTFEESTFIIDDILDVSINKFKCVSNPSAFYRESLAMIHLFESNMLLLEKNPAEYHRMANRQFLILQIDVLAHKLIAIANKMNKKNKMDKKWCVLSITACQMGAIKFIEANPHIEDVTEEMIEAYSLLVSILSDHRGPTRCRWFAKGNNK